MKKYIWISLLILFAFGCGSRKKQMVKVLNSTTFENKESESHKTALNSQTESVTDLSRLLTNKSLKITSNGTTYQLQYGSLLFSGNADFEFKDQKEEEKFKYKYFNRTTYIADTKFVRNIKYETVRSYKKLDVERKGISFGSVIWIVISSLFVGAILWEILKKYIPKWRFNLLKRK